MNLLETVEGYLSTKNEENRNVYSPRIYGFINYLKDEKNITDKNYVEYLSAIKIDIIIESLDNYIKKNSIGKKSVAYFYARTVKRYFSYLNDNGIENQELLKSFALTNSYSYDNQIRKYIENNENLKKVESKDAIEIEDLKLLINVIDEQIDECINHKEIMTSVAQRFNPYNDLVYLLVLKLMIFTGCDYTRLKGLEADCLEIKKLKIKINTYTLHLPDNLGEQLIEYQNIKSERNLVSDKFFVLSNGHEIVSQTREVSDIIENAIGRKDTTGIRKYVITEMIRKGINQSFIMKLTGVGLTMFEDCQNTVNKERHIEANRYIDSKMRDMITFDYL